MISPDAYPDTTLALPLRMPRDDVLRQTDAKAQE
jgi:hypothetical protein